MNELKQASKEDGTLDFGKIDSAKLAEIAVNVIDEKIEILSDK